MKKRLIPFILIVILCTAIMPITAFAADYTWTIGSDVTQSWLDNCDVDTGIARDANNNLWLIYADGALVWHRYKGTTMDNLVEQTQGTRDSSFTRPNGDDNYWCSGLWIDPSDGKWYTTVHVEFKYGTPWPQGGWYRKIQLATSTDNGLTWHNEGDIITSDNPTDHNSYVGNYFDFGPGDQKLFIDTAGGYFYVYYCHDWKPKGGASETNPTMRVARSPISAKMAPGSWQKWYNGSWSQPGIGGHDSDVFPNNTACLGNVFYSTYLGKYVLMSGSVADEGGLMSTCTNMSTQNWTTPETFVDGSRLQWYNFAVDSNGNKMSIGQSFRIYSAQNYYDGVHSKYMPMTLGTGTTTSVTHPKHYMGVSVPDYSPAWDWTPSGAYRLDFTKDIGGFTNLIGNGTWSHNSNGSLNGVCNDADLAVGIDNNSPSLADGYMSFTVKPVSNTRFGGVFRYSSPSSFAVVKYDGPTGNWSISNADGSGSAQLVTQFMDETKAHRIDIAYKGSNVTLKVDFQEIYSGSFSFIPTTAGKVGFRLWYYSNTQFDNLALSSSPDSNSDPNATPIPYSYDFSAGLGGWTKVSGNSTWAVENGELSGTSDANDTDIIDYNSPNATNGTLEFTLKPVSCQRWSAIFRYVNSDRYCKIGFDSGNLLWSIPGQYGTLATGISIPDGSTNTVRIDYKGNNITVLLNGQTIYSGAVLNFPIQPGKIGFSTRYNSHVHFDNVKSYRYYQSFKNNISDFESVSGNGNWILEPVNGELIGICNDADTAQVIDNSSPSIADATLSFDVAQAYNSRFGVIFRYSSSSDYAVLEYDGPTGVWKVQNGSGQGVDLCTFPISSNWHNVSVTYTGTTITLKVDDVQKYSGSVPIVPTTAGKVGFRCWYYSQNNFDNIKIQ